jgi:hypothetical protein
MFEGISRLLERAPGSTPSTLPDNTSAEAPKSETEIRLENINNTIRSNMLQVSSLKKDLDDIDIPYFADKHHPAVQGDMILRDGLITEIGRLEEKNRELEEERVALESNEPVANIN